MSTRLSSVQEQVLDLIAHGSTITAAAASVNLHRTAINHWRACPSFARAYTSAQHRNSIRKQIVLLVPMAFEFVRATMQNPDVSPYLRFLAADFILTLASRVPRSVKTAKH